MRLLAAAFSAALIVTSVGIGVGEAKPGGGGSIGSRGTRTYSAPAATPTAPSGATPFSRSATPSAQAPSSYGAQQSFNGAQRPAGRFGSGFMGGLLGAGLFGALLGAGFMGGLGGIGSFIGLILQLALVFFLVSLALRWFRNRSQPMAVAGQPGMQSAMQSNMRPPSASVMGAPAMGGNATPRQRRVEIAKADYDAFERLLGDVQNAYSNENIPALRRIATPEMVSYFEEELTENNRRGVINKVSDVKLLQGDLAEAWSEPGGDYATVAMRYALTDEMLDRATGKPAPGSRAAPQQATEIWTFVRPANAPSNDAWRLSAIQQAA